MGEFHLAWERLAEALEDGLEALVREHWDVVAVHREIMPLAVDWAGYQAKEDAGVLKLLVARRDGALVGYNSFFFLDGHPHYMTTPHALGDGIFVTKALWHTGLGGRLIDKAEHYFNALVRPRRCRISYHDKIDKDYLKPALQKRGYVAFEVNWDKMVGGPD